MPVGVGLDIGSEAVRAAVVDAGPATPVLRGFAEMALPAGAVVAGEIADEGAVVEAVRALRKRHCLPRRGVVVGIAGSRVVAERVLVPRREENQLAEVLLRRAREALPIPPEEVVVDYLPLEEVIDPGGDPMLSVLLVAAHREVVEGTLRMAHRAGLRVVAVDLQAFGLVRAACGADPGREGAQGLLDIGATLTQLAVVEGGITRFVRMMPTGGNRFTEVLVAGASLPREDAEQRKRHIGVAPSGLPMGEGERAILGRLLSRAADELIEEIRSWLYEYLTVSGQGSLQRLLVAGNGARLPHLAIRIARSLGIRVEPARVLDHVTVGRLRLGESQLLRLQAVLPAAVGLALWASSAGAAGLPSGRPW